MASCLTLKRSYDLDRDSTSNSFESRPTNSSKRARRQYPITVVSSSINDTESSTIENPSVFPEVQPILTADQLLNRIKDEVLRLHRRHQLKTSTNEVVDDEINTSADLTPQESRSTSSTNNQQYLLTLAQVNLICARLLKEREEVLREEYDRILSNKLNEQYEGFLRFTQDQLAQRFSQLQFSYVS